MSARRSTTGCGARPPSAPTRTRSLPCAALPTPIPHPRAREQGPPPGPLELADDHRADHDWSGDLSGLVRLLPNPTPMLDAVNAYASWKSSFKPAAPNLQEPEGAKILDPEHTHSI